MKKLAFLLAFSLVSFLSMRMVFGDDSETADGIAKMSLDQLGAFASVDDVKQTADSLSQSTGNQGTTELSDLVNGKLNGLSFDDLLTPGPSPAPVPEPSDAPDFAPVSGPSDAEVFAPGPGPSAVQVLAPESDSGPSPALAPESDPESEMEYAVSPPAPAMAPGPGPFPELEDDFGDEDSPASALAPELDVDDLY